MVCNRDLAIFPKWRFGDVVQNITISLVNDQAAVIKRDVQVVVNMFLPICYLHAGCINR